MFINEDTKNSNDTRTKILVTSLELFHQGSFAGTSLNQIVAAAGITKGALFHYFKGKNELGYAVVDEVLRQTIHEHWITPLKDSVDPVEDIKKILNELDCEMEKDPEMLGCGCPLNNLAQEVSAIDQSFRLKMCSVYHDWEECLERSLRAGIEAGNVRKDINPGSQAKLLVAMLEGCIGMIKVHQDAEHYQSLGEALMEFLDMLKK